MVDPFEEDEDDASSDPILDDAEDVELSLDDLEDLEEDEHAGHKVTTFDARDDGESYFDGAYFDE